MNKYQHENGRGCLGKTLGILAIVGITLFSIGSVIANPVVTMPLAPDLTTSTRGNFTKSAIIALFKNPPFADEVLHSFVDEDYINLLPSIYLDENQVSYKLGTAVGNTTSIVIEYYAYGKIIGTITTINTIKNIKQATFTIVKELTGDTGTAAKISASVARQYQKYN